MKNKSIIITFAVILIVLVTVLIYIILRPVPVIAPSISAPVIPSTGPTATAIPSVPAGKISIPTRGGDLFINDFYLNNPVKRETIVELAQNNNFGIQFYEPDHSFTLSLSGRDLRKSRTLAEQELLGMLGIDREQACLLSVMVSIPFNVSPELSGTNYHLSFCANGIEF